MADRINFANKINDSVQVGDELHVTNPYAGAVTSFSVGSITAIGEYYVEVNTAPSMTGGATLQNTFYMFKKVNHTSGGVSSYSKSGTKGYYASVKMSTSATARTKLFALGSEIAASSK